MSHRPRRRARRDYDRARITLAAALVDPTAQGKRGSEWMGFVEIGLASLELETGDLARANAHVRRATSALSEMQPDDPDRLDLADVELAIAIAAGEPTEANRLATRMLVLLADRGIEDGRGDRFYTDAAAARLLIGKPDEARQLAERAVAKRRDHHAVPLDLADAEVELAKARYALERDPAALATLRDYWKRYAKTPAARINRAQLQRWFRANRVTP